VQIRVGEFVDQDFGAEFAARAEPHRGSNAAAIALALVLAPTYTEKDGQIKPAK
jgi:hypothetical protein